MKNIALALLVYIVSWELVRYTPAWCDVLGCIVFHYPTREVVKRDEKTFSGVQEMAEYLTSIDTFGAVIENVKVKELEDK